jgi:hypothetical protein
LAISAGSTVFPSGRGLFFCIMGARTASGKSVETSNPKLCRSLNGMGVTGMEDQYEEAAAAEQARNRLHETNQTPGSR